MLAIGLIVGLTIGGAVAGGIWIGTHNSEAVAIAGLRDLQLRASASHGSDTFAIATGPVDEEIEGLYTLDFLTGELNCFVLNARQAGALVGRFNINVTNVLKAARGKKPNYLLTTGLINSPGGGAGGRPAACVCYVVDSGSGEVAAFTFPWVKAATSAGTPQIQPMVLVNTWPTRSRDIR